MNAARADDLPARRRLRAGAGLFALLLGLRSGVRAGEPGQDPDAEESLGPIRIVVAYPPGGVSDRAARLLAEQLAQQMGVAVQVENRAGAGGAVALRALARLPGDGRHLVFCAITPLALDPQLGGSAHAIAPVADVMATPFLLVGTPAFEGQDFADLLRLVHERSDGLRWATSGIATTGHLVLEAVRHGSGGTITHVPYKGGGQQITDALGGQFELLSTNVGPLQMDYVHDGRFVPLAVGAPQRLPALPGVPTLAELGFARANHPSLFGLFAPGSTPPARVRRLNAEVDRALRQPVLRAALLDAYSLPGGGSAADFAAEIVQESRRVQSLLGLRR
jgi:tripartite-type tricarboxylate transporter receptor subunit TctC